MRYLLLALLVCGQLSALTVDDLADKPGGRVKNFLIWQYLKQPDLTPKEADTAFYQLSNVNKKLFMAWAKHSDDPTVRYTAECWNADPKSVLDPKKRDCLLISLSPYKATKLTLKERRKAAELLKGSDDEPWLLMMADSNLSKNIERYDARTSLRVCNSAGTKYRRACFNVPLSRGYLEKLAGERGFSRFVQLTVMDEKMHNLHRALLDLNGTRLDAHAHFYLGLNALRFKQKQVALKHFDAAHKHAYYRMDKDKALFWQYLVTQDNAYLADLNSSFDINLYTLYAAERTGKKIENYYTTLPTVEKKAPVDIRDPFVWNALLQTIRKTPKSELPELAKQYRYRDTYAVQSFITERANGYGMHGYIMPYSDATAMLNADDKALLYALMRQESHFIPSALSGSYALGLMQLMPFLVRDLDKKFNRKTRDYREMFDPERNIAYALRHLQYLEKYLYHPLFIAYAYNGGIGFTKRTLKNGAFGKGGYEPFWSMEMMLNTESREYGKKVLANYVMYKRILGEEVSIRDLLDRLDEPRRTDRFRE